MNKDVMFSSKDQTWSTPISLFNRLNKEFNFTLDPCCLPDSAKCQKYFTPEDNGLIQDWSNDIVFMNPPYNDMYRWVEKAYNESQKGATVVCLIPARTDTKYWYDFCMRASEIRFIKGRLKFGNSDNSAPFPSAIIIFRPTINNLIVTPYSSYITYYNPIIFNKPFVPIYLEQNTLIDAITFE